MAFLSLSLLGPFQAWSANGSMLAFRTLKERALLAYLLVEYGKPQRRDDLAALFWPGRSETIARNNLRQALFGIRQAIGETGFEAIFSVSNEEICANLSDKVWLDLAAYEVHIKAAEQHHSQDEHCSYCLQQLRDAAELVRGQFLEDVSLDKNPQFYSWMTFRREQIVRQQDAVLETLIRQYEAVEDYAQAALYAIQQARLVTSNEPQYQRLMRILAKAGRAGEALEWFESIYRKGLNGNDRAPHPETVALAEEIRKASFEQAVSAAFSVVHNLPENLTPFFNREMELAQLSKLFNNPGCRLINIVGLGGVGKTRLALQAARMRLRYFPDGVYFIPLETISQSDQLISAIGQAIGLAPSNHQDMRTVLFGYLRLKRILLVLDNFEQLSSDKGILLEILQAAPNTRILITSRERLDFQAEFLVELGGLSYPETSSLESIAEGAGKLPQSFAAVRLLLERASRIQPGGLASRLLDGMQSAANLDEEDLRELQAVVQVCKLVDGLPLGIELAASMAGEYTFCQIAEEVQRSLGFLRASLQDLPERQRSLRASFEHSWDLLPESEREVFLRLSVFPSSFSTTSAQMIAGAALPWLRRLEHRSLIGRVSYRRYGLHPLLRQFARDKLRQFSRRVEDQTLQQHAEHYCAFLGEREIDIRSHRQIEVMKEIELDLENIQAAWNWAVEHNAIELLQRAAFSMMYFLEVHSRWYEGEDRFRAAVSSVESIHPLPENVLGMLLAYQGWFCCRLSNFQQAEVLLQRSLDLLETRNAGLERTFPHFALGFLYIWMGRFKEAQVHLSISQSISETFSDGWVKAWASQALTEMAFESGQAGFSDQPFLHTLAQFEQIGEQRGACRALNYLGNIAFANGLHQEARTYYERMLTTVEKVGDVWGAASGYSKLGQLASAAGDYERAWMLQRRSLLMLQKMGDQRRSVYTLRQLAEIAYALKRYADVRECFGQALELASRLRSLSLVQDLFTGLAAVWLQARQPSRAAELLTLLLSEPVGDQMTASRAARLLEQVKPLLAVEDTAVPAQDDHDLALWSKVDQFLRSGIPLPEEVAAAPADLA